MLQVTFTDESVDLVKALLVDRLTVCNQHRGERFFELEASECMTALGAIHHREEMKRLADVVDIRNGKANDQAK